jgi:hypothetical protein
LLITEVAGEENVPYRLADETMLSPFWQMVTTARNWAAMPLEVATAATPVKTEANMSVV